ncbi:MAG: sugar transferase [Candidatus Nitronauta litoralis]|uniref:Sugar transferase n=1 Tax=Candidatus Nitronauta litoralis TaxID=2705533 RepID=A0A7T0BUP9_9BACT|nr:MAG: sugar transferase [Candidatus Nitronauta litoralis]
MKRIFDIVLATLGSVALFPILIGLAILIFCKMGPPVIFSQFRPGLNGKPFRIFKFRTMLERFNNEGNRLPDEERLTSLGRFLRKNSLDELPGLWNVIKGEMSLVGPRPLLVEYLSLYTPEQARRHEVRPGITGWTQIHGHPGITWEEKFELDVWYVDNRSLWIDIKILCTTMLKILKRQMISEEGQTALPKFKGSG